MSTNTEIPTTWADVAVGDVVGGSNDSLWVVNSIDHASGAVVLRKCDTGREAASTVDPAKPVKIVVRSASTAAAAEALVQVHLGGEAIGRKNEHGDWMTPVDFAHHGSLLTHLYVFHGVTGAPEPGDALQQHHAMHQRGLGITAPHVHDPDWLRGRKA